MTGRRPRHCARGSRRSRDTGAAPPPASVQGHQSCNPRRRTKKGIFVVGDVRTLCTHAGIGACLHKAPGLTTRCGWRFAVRLLDGPQVSCITACQVLALLQSAARALAALPKRRIAQAVVQGCQAGQGGHEVFSFDDATVWTKYRCGWVGLPTS